MSTEVTRLEDILRTLTAEQLRYLSERVNLRYDYEAAKAAGIARETVSRWPNKADIDEAVTLMLADGVRVAAEILRRNTAKAAQEMADQIANRSVAVRHKASKDILDRYLGSAPQKHELTGAGGGPITWKEFIEDDTDA